MDCSLRRRAQEETAAKASLRRQVIHLAQRLQLEAHEQYSWPPPALPAEHEPTRRSPVLGSGADELGDAGSCSSDDDDSPARA